MRIALAAVLLMLFWNQGVHAQTSPSSKEVGGVGQRFDHYSTGFSLDGSHKTTPCSSCHVGSIFTGTPTDCVSCHSAAGFVKASRKLSSHNTTTDRCESCHRTSSWSPVLRVDHLETLGLCANCHNGMRAPGKPINHLPTNSDCVGCHRTTFWSMARFTHDGISTNCASCHNGTTALGKELNHISSSRQCESCHNTRSFAMVIQVDHQQVIGICSSCHNNLIAPGQPPDHIPTTAECDSCHNTRGWR